MRVTKDYAGPENVKTLTFQEGESHPNLMDGMLSWMKKNYPEMSYGQICQRMSRIILNMD